MKKYNEFIYKGGSAMEKLTYSVRELAEALGIGISAAYKLTNIEGFPVVQIGARKIIPKAALENWLANPENTAGVIE